MLLLGREIWPASVSEVRRTSRPGSSPIRMEALETEYAPLITAWLAMIAAAGRR